jgi:hypothetical protein
MRRVAFQNRVLILAGVLQGLSGLVLGNLAAYAQSSLSVDGYRATCEQIATSVSSASQVFYPGETEVIPVVVVACHSTLGF